MSATKTETPAADSCSARPCSVRVLPVPVAPATSPWRFIIESGIWTTADRSTLPSCTPRPRSIAGPLVVYAAAIVPAKSVAFVAIGAIVTQ
jgi:hypothetical protein